MDVSEPFVALFFQQFRQSEFGQAAVRLAAELHPTAHWLRQHAAIEVP